MSDEDENPYLERVKAMLDTLEGVEADLDSLADDVDDLVSTPLDEDDLVFILWGRDHNRTKTGTRDALDALSSIGKRDRREVMIRLVAAYSDLTLTDAADFVDDLYQLRDRYGGEDSG